MIFDFNQGLLVALSGSVNETVYAVLYLVFMLVTMVASYLLGSINTAILVSRLLYKDDVRRYGSGNAGLTNMLRTFGGRAAVLTLVGDILKAALSVVIGGVLLGFYYTGGMSLGEGPYVAALFAVIGHIFPIYYRFKGGKGVLVTATVALILSPISFVVLFGCFALILYLTKYVSLASVTSAALYPVTLYAYVLIRFKDMPMPGMIALVSILLAIIILICHKDNLKRIGERTERTFSFKRKPKEPVEPEQKDSDEA